MNKIMATASALALLTGAAQAGGLDRASSNYGIFGEEGRRGEVSISHVRPNVKGTYAAALGGGSTENMARAYSTFSFAYKGDLNESLSYGVFLNTPYGASSEYTSGVYNGLEADWKSMQLAAVASYRVMPGVSVYGGPRAVRSSATITIPDALIRGVMAQAAAAGSAAAAALAASPAGALAYTAEAKAHTAFGYVVGAAYEKPEIALRVDVNYESGTKHKFDTVEAMGVFPTGMPGTVGGKSTTEIKIPYALNLNFQTGIMADTLLFGSVRKSNWSVWNVEPIGYKTLTGTEVTGLDNDVYTFRLGLGRKISDSLSLFARGGYEKKNGGVASRLAPTDGSRSLGFGGNYTSGNMKVTAGVEYSWLGDAVDSSGTKFEGSNALGFGVSIGFKF